MQPGVYPSAGEAPKGLSCLVTSSEICQTNSADFKLLDRGRGVPAAWLPARSLDINNEFNRSRGLGGGYLIRRYFDTFVGDPGTDSIQNIASRRR